MIRKFLLKFGAINMALAYDCNYLVMDPACADATLQIDTTVFKKKSPSITTNIWQSASHI